MTSKRPVEPGPADDREHVDEPGSEYLSPGYPHPSDVPDEVTLDPGRGPTSVDEIGLVGHIIEPPHVLPRALAAMHQRPVRFWDATGFEMVAFSIERIGPDPRPLAAGVMPAEAWDVDGGPEAYNRAYDCLERWPAYGSVSHGTMRPEDLCPIFMGLLEEYDPERAARLTSGYSGDGWPYSMAGLGWGDPFDARQQELAPHLLEDLFNELQGIAPPGSHFGSHEGDGSDYGFWLIDPDEFAPDIEIPPPWAEAIKLGAYDLEKKLDDAMAEYESFQYDWLVAMVTRKTGLPLLPDDAPLPVLDVWHAAYDAVFDEALTHVLNGWGWTHKDDPARGPLLGRDFAPCTRCDFVDVPPDLLDAMAPLVRDLAIVDGALMDHQRAVDRAVTRELGLPVPCSTCGTATRAPSGLCSAHAFAPEEPHT